MLRRSSTTEVLLIGFADEGDSKRANLELSQRRARAVADAFVRDGVEPKLVAGAGSTAAHASGEADEGREADGRVELWLRD